MPIRLVVDSDNQGQRADRYIQNHSAMNYLQTQKALRTGRIRVNGGRVSANHRLSLGDILTLPQWAGEEQQPSSPLADTKDFAKNMLVMQNDDYLIFNKPAGLATQGGTKINAHLDGLLMHFCDDEGVKPRLIHRLDKPTSGLIMAARNRLAATRAGYALKQKHIRKYYLALIDNPLKSTTGTIAFNLLKTHEKMVVAQDPEEGMIAISRYHILSENQKTALILLCPITGRTHQLRVHLATKNAPVRGDRKYGQNSSNGKQLMLHAYHISWQAEQLDCETPPPDYFLADMKLCGLEMPQPPTLRMAEQTLIEME